MDKMTLNDKLIEIQKRLNVPKNQYNNFGDYNFRSCEDIIESVKPLLFEYKLSLIINDKIENIGDRYYIKATAILSDNNEKIQTTAYAREPLDKKKMDQAQVTGATSSYARKYALNGLFAIDDTKDSDYLNYGNQTPKKEQRQATGVINEKQMKLLFAKSKGFEEVAKQILVEKGYNSSKQILAKDFNDILNELENRKQIIIAERQENH